MKEDDNILLDSITKNTVKNNLESPSEDFTQRVMSQVYQVKTTEAMVYKPLIPLKIWIVSAVLAAILLAYALNTSPTIDFKIPSFDLKILTDNAFLRNLSKISLSHNFDYAFISFGIMLLLQVLFLKRHFDKKISL